MKNWQVLAIFIFKSWINCAAGNLEFIILVSIWKWACPFCNLNHDWLFPSNMELHGQWSLCSSVNWPIIAHLPITEHFGRTLWQIVLNSSFWLLCIFSDLKCYRSTFSSSTNHLWNAKPNDQTKKVVKKIRFFFIAKGVFKFFFHFAPLPAPYFKPRNFLISYSFKTI
jgi:hypothetical protein